MLFGIRGLFFITFLFSFLQITRRLLFLVHKEKNKKCKRRMQKQKLFKCKAQGKLKHVVQTTQTRRHTIHYKVTKLHYKTRPNCQATKANKVPNCTKQVSNAKQHGKQNQTLQQTKHCNKTKHWSKTVALHNRRQIVLSMAKYFNKPSCQANCSKLQRNWSIAT